VTLCNWEGNRGSIALIMRYRLQQHKDLQVQRQENGDEHPAYAQLEYGTFTFATKGGRLFLPTIMVSRRTHPFVFEQVSQKPAYFSHFCTRNPDNMRQQKVYKFFISSVKCGRKWIDDMN